MSAGVSANRTCSAPKRTSTMRVSIRRAMADFLMRGDGSFLGGGFHGWHGEQLQPVIHQLVTQTRGDLALQLLDLLVLEFDHPPALQIDQVIVVFGRHLLVARAAVAEIVAFED